MTRIEDRHHEGALHGMALVREIYADTAANDDAEFGRNRRAMRRLALDDPLDSMRLKAAIAEHMLEQERYGLG